MNSLAETVTERMARLETAHAGLTADVREIKADVKTLLEKESERRGAIVAARFIIGLIAATSAGLGAFISHKLFH